ncbi:hypothetical protein LCGC14_2548940, partial [marine sediment metagenome]
LQNIGEIDEPGTGEGTPGEGTGTTADPQATPLTPSGEQGTVPGDATQQQKQVGSPQDLKDKDGNIVATGGKERRFYETAQRERSRADGLERDIETLKSQMEAVNNAGTLGTQYDLTPEELTTGAQIIAAYKKNPVETIQYMLTQAQAQGHNVEAISGSGIDMAAVKQLLDTSLQPLLAEQNQRNDTQEANNRALEIYNEFSAKHPDATVHETSLARLLQQEPSLSPEAAYFKLRSYYHERNLDWTKSLEQLQQEQKLAVPGANTQQALPEGGITTPVTDTDEVADVNASTGDIVKDAMREAGIEIS